jgi:hypothetical protein
LQVRPVNARRFSENPFFVLGLLPSASRDEVEREAKKLLGQLELGVSSVKTYLSPLGSHERSVERVRDALVLLRDVEQRLVAEQWAQCGQWAQRGAAPEALGATAPDSPNEPLLEAAEDGYSAAFFAAGFWR